MAHHHSNPSRRRFLAAAAGMGAAALLTPASLFAEEIDPRIARIVSSTILVDMHNHVNIPYTRVPANARPDPDLDLAVEMKRSGFSAICETFSPDDLFTTEVGEFYKYVLLGLDFQDRMLARNHMRKALTMKDLETAHAAGQPTVILALEGAPFIEGHLERLEVAYKRGLRVVQPVHTIDDLVAPLADIYNRPEVLGGLSHIGVEFIKECNRLGIVVDLSHTTFEAVKAALKVSTQPMLYSHTAMSHTSASRAGTQMRTAFLASGGGWRQRWKNMSRRLRRWWTRPTSIMLA